MIRTQLAFIMLLYDICAIGGFDANILQPFHEAIALESESVLGTAILDHAVLFARNGEYITDDFSVEIPENTKKCLVFGLKAGKWRDGNGVEYTVTEKEAMAEVNACRQTDFKMYFVK